DEKVHFMVTWDRTEGYAWLYINGVKSVLDSTILKTFSITGNYSLMNNRGNTEGILGSIDDWTFFDGPVPVDSILYMKENIGHVYNGCGGGPDWPDPTDDFPTYADSILVVTFEDTPTGNYTEAQFALDFAQHGFDPWSSYSLGLGEPGDINVTIVDVPAVSNGPATTAMRIQHDANAYGMETLTADGSGTKMLVTIPDGYEELYLSYNVLFKENADFFLNGKLPAFRGGETKNQDFRATINFYGTETKTGLIDG
ncbi:unnamed protein product, partial [marine sediment metagenome]